MTGIDDSVSLGVPFPERVQVLIIGGGAAGLTASMLLSQLGVDTLLVERHPQTTQLPKSHVLNQRTMEIFREAEVAGELYRIGAPRDLMAKAAWSTSLDGNREELGRVVGKVDAYGGGADAARYEAAGPCPVTSVAQHHLEPVLRRRAEALAPGRVVFHHELADFNQDSAGVTATIVDRDNGVRHIVRADYLLGTDGGRTVGPGVGIATAGLTDLGEVADTHFSADLSAHVEDRSVLLNFLINPDSSIGAGTLTKLGPERWDEHSEEWKFTVRKRPGQRFDEATATARIRESLGIPDLDLKIHSVTNWKLEAVLADRYRVGRVFVAGDAAHRHSPTGGLGLNTAVQDVHNLAWKLHAALSGHAGDALLDSYEAERRPVAAYAIERATAAFHRPGGVDTAIGLRPGMPAEETWPLFTDLFSGTPETAELRDRVAAAVARERREFGALNAELGFTYSSSAVVTDASPEPFYGDKAVDFTAQTRPGHRMPHVWLVFDGERLSTYDLTGRGRFTLLVDVDDNAWTDAAVHLATHLNVPLDVLRIGSGDWEQLREVDGDGAVLVRPDQHVAWRSHGASTQPVAVLERVLRYVLGRLQSPHTAP